MNLLLLKIFVTISFILVLSVIAERATPRLAGILSGYPLGTALVLFFYGLQFGPGFAVDSIPYNLAGHASAQVFVFAYFLAARSSALASVALATVAAAVSYFLSAALVSMLSLSLFSASLFSFTSIAIFSWLFRAVPNHRIERRVDMTPGMLAFRIAVSTAIVLVVTGLAGSVGPRWAGLFSAFPMVVYPLVLLMHVLYGVERAHTVLKNFPRGLWTVLSYSVTIAYAYPLLGVYLGTLVGYVVATAVLLIINRKVLWEDVG
jgi:hypothetical protein